MLSPAERKSPAVEPATQWVFTRPPTTDISHGLRRSWALLEEMFLDLADRGPRERIPEIDKLGDLER